MSTEFYESEPSVQIVKIMPYDRIGIHSECFTIEQFEQMSDVGIKIIEFETNNIIMLEDLSLEE